MKEDDKFEIKIKYYTVDFILFAVESIQHCSGH